MRRSPAASRVVRRVISVPIVQTVGLRYGSASSLALLACPSGVLGRWKHEPYQDNLAMHGMTQPYVVVHHCAFLGASGEKCRC
jgi:hypothetical protein